MTQTAKQTLYRKYRPQTFGELLGQDHIVKTLQTAIAGGRLSHAYLFSGPRGTGKTSAARLLAKSLNCLSPVSLPGGLIDACRVCDVCKRIEELAYMDIIEIDAASNNGVDDIREMREKVKYRPVEGKNKVYIIDEVHMLSGAAFNAFLKTLEEPPPGVVFILATTDPQKVPATIISRCQCFDFHAIPRRIIVERLVEVGKRERELPDHIFPEIPVEVLQIIAESADGGFRDALSLLDQISSGHVGGTVTVEEILGLTRRLGHATLKGLSQSVFTRDASTVLRQVNDLFARGYDVASIGRDLLEFFRKALLLKIDPQANQVLELPGEQAREIAEAVRALPVEYLMATTLHLERTLSGLRHSVQPKLLFEIELVRLAQREVSLGLEGVERRLQQLEDLSKTPRLTSRSSGAAPLAMVPPAPPRPGTVTPFPGSVNSAPITTSTSPVSPGTGSVTPFPRPAAGTDGIRPTPLPAKKTFSGVPVAGEIGGRWSGFRDRLSQVKPMVGSYFQTAIVESFKDGILTVCIDNDFAIVKCREPKTLEFLQPLLEEFFGAGTRLHAKPPGNKEPSPGFSTASSADRTNREPGTASTSTSAHSSAPAPMKNLAESIARIDQAAKQKILSQPAVTEALQVFGGEIIQIERP
ncbi:MAG: DNA polymerase III subunit gamma/tau [Candidatus Ozemobacteraceae bacterium]